MIGGKTDVRGIELKLEDFYAETKKPLSAILRQVARIECVSFARSTQPYTSGDDWASSQNVGMRRVGNDINRLFGTKGKVFSAIKATKGVELADAFYQKFEQGKFGGKKGAQAIMAASGTAFAGLNIEAFNPVVHKESRGRQGRIARGAPPRSVVKNRAPLDSYIAKKQKMVGFAKSGWATAARGLGGTRGIPGWVTRRNAPGEGIDRSKLESNPHVTFHNKLPYASEVLPPTAESEAIKSAHDRLTLMIEEANRKAASKVNAKQYNP